ncbi:MAG: cytidine deaminase [Gemmatimonadaceae bacterium]|nr:cytidine deaminase [Gemmatimonadaceae bacterium]
MADASTLAALRAAAFAAMDNAYAPYSKFHVGAALLTADGQIIAGCNVENSAYPAGSCAERVAVGAAVARGLRSFTHVVVATAADTPTPPCGICRQVLQEFAPGCRVISVTRGGAEAQWDLAELLPSPFMPSSLRRE